MKINRRKILLGAVAGAGLGIPLIKHIKWNQKSFVHNELSGDDGMPVDIWSNRSGNQKAFPKNIFVPHDEGHVAEYISSSTGVVRPVGSGHSFTGLIPTDGSIVDISRLNGILEVDIEEKGLCTGIRVLYRLDRKNKDKKLFIRT